MGAYAAAVGIPVYKPDSTAALTAIIQTYQPDYTVVVAYGRLIPKAITDAYFCINIHPSLLPKYRGATPIQAAILNGDTVSGITLIRMTPTLDAGPILDQVAYPVSSHVTWGEMHADYAQKSAALCLSYIKKWEANQSPEPRVQDEFEASICKKLGPDDAKLDQTESVKRQYAVIRALSPVPGAYIMHNNCRIKILSARLILNEKEQLVPYKIQVAGKNPVLYSDYLRGNPAIL